MDRPALNPFELLDQIEQEFGMQMAPVLWPIGDGERFKVCLQIVLLCRGVNYRRASKALYQEKGNVRIFRRLVSQ